MWLDADAFFTNDAENIISVLNDNDEIYLSSHYCSVHKGSNYKNTILTTNRINCGVMIFKVSEFNEKFLENVWSKENYINHYWYEQAAIMDLVGLKADITGNLNDNKGNDFYLKKMHEWGIECGTSGKHLRALNWALSQNTLAKIIIYAAKFFSVKNSNLFNLSISSFCFA